MKIYLSFCFILMTINLLAQSPGFNYQAVLRDDAGQVMPNTDITLFFTLKDGNDGVILYKESHSMSSNEIGLLNTMIGTGTVESGIYEDIIGVEDLMLQVGLQMAGSQDIIDFGNNGVGGVPYALYGKDDDADPENEMQSLSLSGDSLNISGRNGIDIDPIRSKWRELPNQSGYEFVLRNPSNNRSFQGDDYTEKIEFIDEIPEDVMTILDFLVESGEVSAIDIGDPVKSQLPDDKNMYFIKGFVIRELGDGWFEVWFNDLAGNYREVEFKIDSDEQSKIESTLDKLYGDNPLFRFSKLLDIGDGHFKKSNSTSVSPVEIDISDEENSTLINSDGITLSKRDSTESKKEIGCNYQLTRIPGTDNYQLEITTNDENLPPEEFNLEFFNYLTSLKTIIGLSYPLTAEITAKAIDLKALQSVLLGQPQIFEAFLTRMFGLIEVKEEGGIENSVPLSVETDVRIASADGPQSFNSRIHSNTEYVNQMGCGFESNARERSYEIKRTDGINFEEKDVYTDLFHEGSFGLGYAVIPGQEARSAASTFGGTFSTANQNGLTSLIGALPGADPTSAYHILFNGPNFGSVASINNEAAGFYSTYGANGNINSTAGTFTGDADGGAFITFDQTGNTGAYMWTRNDGSSSVGADQFVMTASPNGRSDISVQFSAPMGEETAAYDRGTAQLVNGEATVICPEHFQWIADEASMTVTITPLSAESKGIAVIEKAAGGFKVKELNGGKGNYAFDYLVMCKRKGYENQSIITENNNPASINDVKELSSALPKGKISSIRDLYRP